MHRAERTTGEMGRTADHETRKKIVSVATELFHMEPGRRLKLHDVAAACGMSRFEVARHFHSVEKLFRECASNALNDMNEVLYWHSAKSVTLSEKLRLIAGDLIALKKNRPGVLRMFKESSEEDKEQFFIEAIEVMRYGVRSGELRGGVDTRLAALMFFGTLFVMLDGGAASVDPASVISLVFSGIAV